MDVLIKSRDGCIFCERAKGMLQALNVVYREEYQPSGAVPQIYINGSEIGGFDQLQELVFDEDRWNEVMGE
jgi:glutaredoxin